jgi:hypothetical protein
MFRTGNLMRHEAQLVNGPPTSRAVFDGDNFRDVEFSAEPWPSSVGAPRLNKPVTGMSEQV